MSPPGFLRHMPRFANIHAAFKIDAFSSIPVMVGLRLRQSGVEDPIPNALALVQRDISASLETETVSDDSMTLVDDASHHSRVDSGLLETSRASSEILRAGFGDDDDDNASINSTVPSELTAEWRECKISKRHGHTHRRAFVGLDALFQYSIETAGIVLEELNEGGVTSRDAAAVGGKCGGCEYSADDDRLESMTENETGYHKNERERHQNVALAKLHGHSSVILRRMEGLPYDMRDASLPQKTRSSNITANKNDVGRGHALIPTSLARLRLRLAHTRL